MLEWMGKQKVVNHHNDVPFQVLERKWSFVSRGGAENAESLDRINKINRLGGGGPGGAIFISIDDNELYSLKLVGDEIFGANCFVGDISWQRTYSTRNEINHHVTADPSAKCGRFMV